MLLTTIIRVTGAGLQLVFVLAISRLLGPAEAGVFFFGYSIILILAVLARLGTELSGLRLVSAAAEQGAATALKKLVLARVLLTLLASVALGLSILFIEDFFFQARFGTNTASKVVLVLALALPAFALLGLFAEFLKAVKRPNSGVTAQNIAVPGGATLVFLWALLTDFDADPVFVAITVAVIAWFSLVVTLLVWLRWFKSWSSVQPADQSAASENGVISLIKEAPVLLVVSTTSIAMQWMGAVILGIVSSPETVAGYSVSIRMAIVVSTLNSAIASIFAPRMAAAHHKGDLNDLRRNAHQMSLLISGATFPILVVLFLFSDYWLSFFGQEYVTYSPALRILIVGQVVAALIGHSGTVLVMAGEYRRARLTSLVALGILIPTMFVFASAFETAGAAAAMSIAVISGHLAALWFVRQQLGFWSIPVRARGVRDLFA